ncbi:MAG: glutamate-1-semialdehyde 2,1-aminomutase [Pseudomonadota bacterium]|nr:glutamate-1-semialdehyde 2,1-aminomutase [Pseudomonadota bacterium]
MTNQELFNQSRHLIPGGVNSPVRAFGAVGGNPIFIERGDGCKIIDVEGNSYIDYVGSWGPLILGHNDPDVRIAVLNAINKGLSFGTPTEGELRLAEEICRLIPSVEMVRLVSSGTEATMSAIRLARAYTKRDLIIKFEGCYHGHADSLLVKSGSGALTFGQPTSAGVPKSIAQLTLPLPYNNIDAVISTFNAYGNDIAAIIVEPIAGNMNLVIPDPQFLQTLRNLSTQYGSILIFDEVMTGFRVALGGAQYKFGIKPDLTTLGKIIGGGLPVGAFGGRSDIMKNLAPEGSVYQAGTLSGNPVAVAAGLATLGKIQSPGFYEKLHTKAELLIHGLIDAASVYGVPFSAQSVGGMFGLYFREEIPTCLEEAKTADSIAFNRFFHAMLSHNVYLAPSAYEAGFMSAAHTENDIKTTIEKSELAFSTINHTSAKE